MGVKSREITVHQLPEEETLHTVVLKTNLNTAKEHNYATNETFKYDCSFRNVNDVSTIKCIIC